MMILLLTGASASVTSEILGIISGVILTLIGLIYRRVRDTADDNEKDISDLETRVDTLTQWAFGTGDGADYGISKDIEDGFDTIEDECSTTKERVAELEKRVERLERDMVLMEDVEEKDVPLESDN